MSWYETQDCRGTTRQELVPVDELVRDAGLPSYDSAGLVPADELVRDADCRGTTRQEFVLADELVRDAGLPSYDSAGIGTGR
jgi:hypothetical protein